jgi:hypothetical protein
MGDESVESIKLGFVLTVTGAVISILAVLLILTNSVVNNIYTGITEMTDTSESMLREVSLVEAGKMLDKGAAAYFLENSNSALGAVVFWNTPSRINNPVVIARDTDSLWGVAVSSGTVLDSLRTNNPVLNTSEDNSEVKVPERLSDLHVSVVHSFVNATGGTEHISHSSLGDVLLRTAFAGTTLRVRIWACPSGYDDGMWVLNICPV